MVSWLENGKLAANIMDFNDRPPTQDHLPESLPKEDEPTE